MPTAGVLQRKRHSTAEVAKGGRRTRSRRPPCQRASITEADIRSIRESQSSVLGRVAAVERQMSSSRICNHTELIDERVNSFRIRAKVDILCEMARPLRTRKVHEEEVFGSVLYRSAITME